MVTTSSGCPVHRDATLFLDQQVVQDVHLMDKIGHFDRERIPERVVYAKGAGAHGYFEVTDDCAALTSAKFLNRIGKRTPIFARFSNFLGERGSSDSVRDIRGFALKFYTEEGIWDLGGSNSPVFFIRDPLKYPDLVHTQKRHRQTNCFDKDAYWDFLSLCPESIHQLALLYSDRGIPKGHCHMNGYSSHTYKFVNAKGHCFNLDEYRYVKFHFKSDQGIQNFTDEEARKLAGTDPDFATKDLFSRIASAKFPSWTVYVQVMEPEHAATYRWNLFDCTKVWPHSDFPLQQIGKIVLNRNPENHFAEVEQVAFSPSHIVPGIDFSQDKMLLARLFACKDAARYRLGTNLMQIPINAPYTTRVHNHQRDGTMSVNGNGGSKLSYDRPAEQQKKSESEAAQIAQTARSNAIVRPVVASDDDYVQAGVFWRNVLSNAEKQRVVQRLVESLSVIKKPIAARVVAMIKLADEQWGKSVEEGLLVKARV